MADALCGPSNPLQSFQKHTAVDRSLQQDRLSSRQPGGEGFRSLDPNAGILDPEFEAFQSQPPSAFFESPSWTQTPHAQHHISAPSQAAPEAVLGWAADFQRLHLSPPAPSLAAASFSEQQTHQPSRAWHEDFVRQSQSLSPASMQRSAYRSRFGGMQSYGMQQPFNSMQDSPQLDGYSVAQGKRRRLSLQVDDAALAREFDAYASEIARQEETGHLETQRQDTESKSTSMEMGQDVNIMEDLKAQARALNSQSFEDLREQARNHSSEQTFSENPAMAFTPNMMTDHLAAMPKTEILPDEQKSEAPKHEDDQLAFTAGEVLERLSDNSTKKFQDSTFLALMRQLRDREVRVEGDKMVNVDDSSTPTPKIPLAEQDLDQGRDVRMAGALRPPNDSGESGDRFVSV